MSSLQCESDVFIVDEHLAQLCPLVHRMEMKESIGVVVNSLYTFGNARVRGENVLGVFEFGMEVVDRECWGEIFVCYCLQ